MSVYFDASLLVSLFIEDTFSDRAQEYVTRYRPRPTVSDLATAEAASAIGRKVRVKEISRRQGLAVLADFDAWRARETTSCHLQSADIAGAEAYIRRLDLPLKTPDAINIAIAARLELPLATFDEQMKDAAVTLGLSVAPV